MELDPFIPRVSASINTDDERYQEPFTRQSGDLIIKNVSQRRKEYKNTKLLDAAQKGNSQKCKSLVEEETADVNCQCRGNGATPVTVATAWGHLQTVQELVNLGADITIADFNNRTPVHIAAANGSLNILKIFLEKSQGNGCNELEFLVNKQVVNVPQDQTHHNFDSWVHKHTQLLPKQMPEFQEGSTPLHAASQWSRFPCVKYLLFKGANPGLLDYRGLTALDVAGEKKIVLPRNASDSHQSPSSSSEDISFGPRTFSMAGKMPLFEDSSKSGSETSLSEKTDNEGTTFMGEMFDKMPIAGEEDTDKGSKNETTGDVIQILFGKWRQSIENISSISKDDNLTMRVKIVAGEIKKSVTCLHTTVKSGNIELLRSLSIRNDKLEENLHVFDKDGLTPLHRAVIMRRLDIVATILENGMQHLINMNDCEGRTLLFLAVEIEWIDGIDYFLNNGAELSLSSRDNSNILHVAARLGNVSILSELVQFERGIMLVNSVNSKHHTPLWYAVKKSSAACVSLLLQAGADVSAEKNSRSLLHLAAENPSPETLRLLLDYGGRSMIADMFEGMTPLHVACRKGIVDCVEVLVEYGGDVKGKTGVVDDFTSGGTCLHLAARYGHLRVVEYLVKHDKSLLNIPNDDKWFPLHVAARCGKSDCAHVLIVSGADLSVQVVDRFGNMNTAIDLIVCSIPQPQAFFQRILDDSIESNGLPANHSSCQIKCKYNVLIPVNREKRQLKALVSLIVRNNDNLLENTIIHPLIESFLFLKWEKLRVFFMVVIALYVTFTVSFTALSVAMMNGNPVGQNFQQNNTSINLFDKYIWRSLNDIFLSDSAVMLYKFMTIGSLLIICPVEIYQAVTLRLHYFLKIESWLKATIMVLSIWSFLMDSDSSNASSISAVVILCLWCELLFLLACLPNWGFGVLMFCKVAQNVIKVLVTFSCLIVGFTFAFMVLFQSSEHFVTFWLSLVKIMVMMSEYEYADIFSGREGPDYLARTIFLAFLILVSIVMMNLMVGIAVSDIALLEDQGRVSQLVKQIEFLDLLEVLVYNDLFLKILPKRAGRALRTMRAAQTECIFRPGRLLNNKKTSLPPNLHQSIMKKADELNSRLKRAYQEKLSWDPKTNHCEPCKCLASTFKCEETALKLQSIVEELAGLKNELRLLKSKKSIRH